MVAVILAICTLFSSSCTKSYDTGHGYFLLAPPDVLGGFSLKYVDNPHGYSDRPDFSLVLTTISRSNTYKFPPEEDGTHHSSREYYRERLKNIIEVVEKDDAYKKHFYNAPCFIDAGIMEEVKVYADKAIFGREAGEDISDHIVLGVISDRNEIISTYPDFIYVGKAEKGMCIRDYYGVGTALQGHEDIFTFDCIPDDMPGTFQLTFEIPVDLNVSWSRFSWMETSNGYEAPLDTCVYTATTEVVCELPKS